jgi:hypothetical protein
MSTTGRRRRAATFLRRHRAATILASIFAALILGAGTALAAVAALPSTNAVGSAGYQAHTTDPAGFTDSQAVVNAGQYGLTVKGPGAQGSFLCDHASGLFAGVGEFSTNLNTAYTVQASFGVPTGGCPGNGPPATVVNLPALAGVPFGHHLWTHVLVTHKVKTIRILICILKDRSGETVPTPTPSVALPTASVEAPSSTAPPTDISGSGGTEEPSATPSTESPTASPSATPTGSPTVNPQGQTILSLPGFLVRCHIITRTIARNTVTFEAQDLDAPTVTPTAGDLPGVQTATRPLPAGTVFDIAGAGVNENLTGLVACSGIGFPAILAGPAAYTSRACQPLSVFEFATATVAAGSPQDYGSLDTSEVISPNASAALMAPNNSLSATGATGPHAPTGSATGSVFHVFSANAPTS